MQKNIGSLALYSKKLPTPELGGNKELLYFTF